MEMVTEHEGISTEVKDYAVLYWHCSPSPDTPGDGQDVPPRLLPLLRVQRVPRRRPLHRRLRQQDLLRQRLSQDLRAKVRSLRRSHHSRGGAWVVLRAG